MTIAHRFDYERPDTLSGVLDALARCGGRARVLAGGTDLIGWIREDLIAPDVLIDLKALDELKVLHCADGVLQIGAGVTFNQLLESDAVRSDFPLVFEMAGRVASNGVRNRATMAGNICSAVPCNDSGPVLLVYEATLHVAGPTGTRDLSALEWFLGPRKTALQPDEVLTGITLKKPEGRHGGCWLKLGRYKGEDLAQASTAILMLENGETRIAFGSVAPVPLRAPAMEALLKGRTPDAALIAQAQAMLSDLITPITDVRASLEYRLHMVGVMLERGLPAAAERMNGNGPDYGTTLI
ncbi:MAG: xanthine dehydrogenase family protein subunit M [Kiritimatiellae bacterium]|nr:xanthine dehydrogenase family protein subunit M [Kiritimatiellia bacterium]